MSLPRSFYVTTPIYYVNDKPHIGHTYTTVVADCLARYHRMCGDDVWFLTGTDEHGQKIERAAKARGIDPKTLADEVVENYRQLWPALSISHDDFIRTTDKRHRDGVYALLEKIKRVAPDAIYKGSYRGPYCTGCESFFAPSQIVDGKCPDQGHPVEEVEETSWFFRLSAYQEKLLALYEAHPEFVRPETRLNEVRAFVASGLRDLSISRSRSVVGWGIPFPGDDEHVIYVWFDALTNYLSALGYGQSDDSLVKRFWTTMQGESLHIVGKDILRFHAVYWPAFLMAAQESLPTTVLGHGWWLRDNAKMSKSLGNVARVEPLLADFGADAVRWFLLREIPLGMDGSYSDEAIFDRSNSDLANNIGNLYSRVTTLIEKGESGLIPGGVLLEDEPLATAAAAARVTYRDAMERNETSLALRALTDWSDALNKYLVRQEPWKRAGREADCTRVLATAAQHLAQLALRLAPAMPVASARLWSILGLGDDPAALIARGTDLFAAEALPVAGRRVRAGEAIFPRLDRKAIFGDLASRPGPAPPVERKPVSSTEPEKQKSALPEGLIEIDQFFQTKLRVAKVLVAEKHPSADKLLRLEVDLGDEKRQIVAGIAKAYLPEQLVGRTIIVVANLKPAMLRGVESQGMLLAATGPDGVPHLLGVDAEVPPGAKVG
ncbi:MAG: methionine--tRNA ligase [Acidobacteriota bacterium]